jgi:hypothetical protein
MTKRKKRSGKSTPRPPTALQVARERMPKFDRLPAELRHAVAFSSLTWEPKVMMAELGRGLQNGKTMPQAIEWIIRSMHQLEEQGATAAHQMADATILRFIPVKVNREQRPKPVRLIVGKRRKRRGGY